MSVNARRILNAIRDADHALNDPGSSGRIEIAGDLQICELSTTSAESRTLDGVKGDIVHDTDYIYVCTATNTWKRAAIATW